MLRIFTITLLFLSFQGCGLKGKQDSGFDFQESDQGVELSENGRGVFFYQMVPVAAGPNPVIDSSNRFNHYFHPFYNLDGEVITEAQPEDDQWHPHHRGIFWGWHQLYIRGEDAGDSWTMDHMAFEIDRVEYEVKEKKAVLDLQVQWISTASGNRRAFVEERDRIIVFPVKDGKRVIDFKIGLRGLLPGIEIGGSSDTIKGYSGFSARINLADSMLFLSEKGPVIPINGQLQAGPWVDFSNPLVQVPQKYGLTMMCHPSTPGSPPPWLLRSQASMQNPAFPGFLLAAIPQEEETILRYRLIVHDGDASLSKISRWYKSYVQTK